MEQVDSAKPNVLSIELPTSVRRVRSLNPNKPIDALSVKSRRLLSVKLARELSKWKSIRALSLWCTTSKAALRELLTTAGLEEINLFGLHDHSSLKGMPLTATLRTFRCGGLSSSDLLSLSELQELSTLGAQYSQLSKAAVSKLVGMKSLVDLDLEGSNLDDEMASNLATSEKLVSLSIGATRVGPRGLESICQMSQLRELDVWALDIQESDLENLSKLTNLEYLSVGGHDGQTVLTAKGVLPKMSQLPSLKRLWLDGIPFSNDEVNELKMRYEHVKVTFAE